MRIVYYEMNGTIYHTKAEAPEGATVKLKDAPEYKGTYNPKRVAKIRERGREKRGETA